MYRIDHSLVPVRQQQLLHEAEQARAASRVRKAEPKLVHRLRDAFSLRLGVAW